MSQTDPLVDGGEYLGVTAEVETAAVRAAGQFLLIVVLLVVKYITLYLQVQVINVTKPLDHFQHVQT